MAASPTFRLQPPLPARAMPPQVHMRFGMNWHEAPHELLDVHFTLGTLKWFSALPPPQRYAKSRSFPMPYFFSAVSADWALPPLQPRLWQLIIPCTETSKRSVGLAMACLPPPDTQRFV